MFNFYFCWFNIHFPLFHTIYCTELRVPPQQQVVLRLSETKQWHIVKPLGGSINQLWCRSSGVYYTPGVCCICLLWHCIFSYYYKTHHPLLHLHTRQERLWRLYQTLWLHDVHLISPQRSWPGVSQLQLLFLQGSLCFPAPVSLLEVQPSRGEQQKDRNNLTTANYQNKNKNVNLKQETKLKTFLLHNELFIFNNLQQNTKHTALLYKRHFIQNEKLYILHLKMAAG